MSYNDTVKKYHLLLVEFFASWCPHCQRMMPIVAQVKELLGNEAAVLQFDIDQNQQFAKDAGVEGIPTFIVYVNGVEQWRHSGEIDGNDLLAKVQSFG